MTFSIPYSQKLVQRFVSDFNLPIPIVSVENLFYYYLETFNEYHHGLEKYTELSALVNQNYNGTPELFVEDYCRIRDAIVTSFKENEAYQKFSRDLDMNKFAIADRPNVTEKSIYNQESAYGLFFSIDMKKANFQAVRFIDPSILGGKDTYEDFVGQWTDIEYIKQSKYTRQVIFGQLNPKRHITVEKYLTNEIRKIVDDVRRGWDMNMCLVSQSNDEIVYRILPPKDGYSNTTTDDEMLAITDVVKSSLGLDVEAEIFQLGGYTLRTKNRKAFDFYERRTLKDGCFIQRKLKCIPLPFFPIAYKLLRDKPLCSSDYLIQYEGFIAELKEQFDIVKI